MSLLNPNTEDTEQPDDAAQGEDFSKGSSHLLNAVIVSGIVVTILIAIYVLVFASAPVPPSTGQVVNVWAYPLHTKTAGFDANGAALTVENFDRILVFAEVRIHNQGKSPLIMHEVLSNVTISDGIHSSYAASLTDFQRLFVAYPQLGALSGSPLNIGATLDPGQTISGTIFSSFNMSEQDFKNRKDLNFSFAFKYNPTLVITPTQPVQTPTLATPLDEPTKIPGVKKEKQATAASVFQ
jgi:hypothetical protein